MTDKPAITDGRDRPFAALAALAPLRHARLELERLLDADARFIARRLHLAEAASGRTSAEPPRTLSGDPIYQAWSRLDAALTGALPAIAFARPEDVDRAGSTTIVGMQQATTETVVVGEGASKPTDASPVAPGSLRAALVTVGAPEFRTRVRMKSAEVGAVSPAPVAAAAAEALGALAAQPATLDIQPAAFAARPDILTRIRGITPALAGALEEAGVTSFAAIAAWTSTDTRRISSALALGRRISRENWIEQAALLARHSDVAAPTPPAAPVPPPGGTEADLRTTTVIVIDAVRIDAVISPGTPVLSTGGEDVQRVDEPGAMERTADVASDVAGNEAQPRDQQSVAPEQSALTLQPPPEGSAGPAPDATSAPQLPIEMPRLVDVLATSAAKVAPPESPSTRSTAPTSSYDDLLNMRGMTPLVADRLRRRGNVSVAEIARWTSDDVARMAVYLGPSARISGDQWIEQAAVLAAGRATAFARRRLAGDLSALTATAPEKSQWVPEFAAPPLQPAAAPAPTSSTEQAGAPETEVVVSDVAPAAAPVLEAEPVVIMSAPSASVAEVEAPDVSASTERPLQVEVDAVEAPNQAATVPPVEIKSDHETDDEHDVAALLARTSAVQEQLGQRLSRLQRDISGIRLESAAVAPEAEAERVRRREALSRRLDRLAQTPATPAPPLLEATSAAKPRVPTRPRRTEAPTEPDDATLAHGHEADLDEADVRIVTREAKSDRQPLARIPDSAPPTTPRQAIHISPRRLIERLKRARDGRGSGRSDIVPAAFRSANEEASVEIVTLPDGHAGRRADTPAPPAAPTATPAAPATAKPTTGTSRAIRSFDGKS